MYHESKLGLNWTWVIFYSTEAQSRGQGLGGNLVVLSGPLGFPDGAVVKNPPANARDARDVDWSLGWEDPLE